MAAIRTSHRRIAHRWAFRLLVDRRDSKSPELVGLRPPGTVVLIVKPPGSRLEIEIKRTGKGEDLPLVASYERSGRPVPRSHRLDGGSMALSLRFEAAASASYATVYRTVWRCPAPVPTSLSVRFIDTLPVDDHAEHIIDYFTNAEVFKDKFAAMRRSSRSASRGSSTRGARASPSSRAIAG